MANLSLRLLGAVALLGVTGGELAIYDATREELVVAASHQIGTGDWADGSAATGKPLDATDLREHLEARYLEDAAWP